MFTDVIFSKFDYIGNTNKTYYVKALLGYTSETLDVDSDYKKIDFWMIK